MCSRGRLQDGCAEARHASLFCGGRLSRNLAFFFRILLFWELVTFNAWACACLGHTRHADLMTQTLAIFMPDDLPHTYWPALLANMPPNPCHARARHVLSRLDGGIMTPLFNEARGSQTAKDALHR